MVALLIAITGIHLVALATPGPDFFFVSQVAASKSRLAGFKAVLGISLGVVFWATLTLLGLEMLLKKATWLQQAIMIAGGCYLCYLAYLLLQSALAKKKTTLQPQATAQNSHISATPSPCPKEHIFLKGFLTNLSNPKAVIYFGSVFSGVVGSVSDNSIKWWILALITLETMLWFSMVALIFSLPSMQRGYQKSAQWIDGCAGTLFAGFGLYLIYKGIKDYMGYATP